MITYSNAPNYRYNGYRYVPQIEHEDEEGIRKATHFVYRVEDIDPNNQDEGMATPDFIVNASPYRWLTYDEFTYHVDMMRGNPPQDITLWR